MGTSHKVVFLDRASVKATVRRPACAEQYVEHEKTSADEIVAKLAGATVAITNKVPLRAATVDALPELKMIAIAATGANHIDLAACRARGIVVSNIRGYAEHTVPEHVLSLILALLRNLAAWRQTLQAGAWSQASQFCLFEHPIRDLHGSTLALVGSGSLGQGVARLASAFGMRVLQVERKGVATPRPGYVSFAQALAEADVLSLHCPLTPETRHLIGEAELRAMRRDALLINTNSRTDTYPAIPVRGDKNATQHEASVSKVSEDMIFYMQQRGLTEAQAMSLAVNGFINDLARQFPMEYSVELKRLIDLEMEGSVG